MRQDTNNEVDRPKERRLWPPRRVFVTLASLVAAVVLVRFDVRPVVPRLAHRHRAGTHAAASLGHGACG